MNRVVHTNEPGDRDIAEIAAQAVWVRRLAVALAHGSDAGEDIAQDALLAALRDPHTSRDLRAWLFGVVQNLARLRVRSTDRRTSRERNSARSEETVDPVLALERLEMQECLLGAVRELPEPYRTTVVLRWFEELAPEEIARRTSTPVRTVHTRLQRALRLLREALDRRAHGDRSRWLAAWLPVLPRPGSVWPLVLVMQLKTKLVIAALAVGAAVSLWFAVEALRPVDRASTPTLASEPAQLESANTTRDSRPLVTNDGRRAMGRESPSSQPVHAATTSGLTVRSSIGLTFAFFEWRTSLGEWRRQDLEEGRCAATDMQFPCQVRAPGHVLGRAERDGAEVVLEPDELLVIVGDDLRSCTSSIRVEDPFHPVGEPMTAALERACIGGYLSANEWAMAASHDLIREGRSDGEATAVVVWRDQHRADVHLHPIANVRARWSLPCDDRPPCAPLTVRVRRPPAVSQAGKVALQVTSLRNESGDAQWETFEWGRAATYSTNQLWVDEARVESNADEFTYSALPLGESLLVFARDEASGAYGRVEFLHDGSSRTIELQPAFELVVRLISAIDSSPVRDARVTLTFPGGSDESITWTCTDGRTSHASDGVFRRLLPGLPLLRAVTPLEPPSRFLVRVEAAGFEAFEKLVESGGDRQIDCGEVRLTALAGKVVLAPGHGLEPKSVEWMPMRTSVRPEFEWIMRNAALGADGSLSVFLVESDNSTRASPLFDTHSWTTSKFASTAWPDEQPQWVVLHVLLGDRDEDWLFERRADGLFAAVPRIERELVLECGALPPQGEPNAAWHVGWTWRGRWGQLAAGPRTVGEVVRLVVSTPVDGASLYWSAKGPPPGVLGAPIALGGTIPLASLTGKLVLR
jgi:RNA polymerase sigma-70 factor (ECF subfamily)